MENPVNIRGVKWEEGKPVFDLGNRTKARAATLEDNQTVRAVFPGNETIIFHVVPLTGNSKPLSGFHERTNHLGPNHASKRI